MHAMLDIETLGTDPNAPVLSAAIVFFDPETETVHESKMFLFSPNDQPDRPINFDTMKWWMDQTKEAAAHWKNATPGPIRAELEAFRQFANKYNVKVWWANSPAFDEVIMSSLFKDFGIQAPWKFWTWRDVRTVKNFLRDRSPPKNTNAHDPTADCLAQIELVFRFYSEQAMIELLQEG